MFGNNPSKELNKNLIHNQFMLFQKYWYYLTRLYENLLKSLLQMGYYLITSLMRSENLKKK